MIYRTIKILFYSLVFFSCNNPMGSERNFEEVQWFRVNAVDEIVATDSMIYLISENTLGLSVDDFQIQRFFRADAKPEIQLEMDIVYEGSTLGGDTTIPAFRDVGSYVLTTFSVEDNQYKIYYLDENSYFLIDWGEIKYTPDNGLSWDKIPTPYDSEIRKIKVDNGLAMIIFDNNTVYSFDPDESVYSLVFEGDTTDRYDRFLDVATEQDDIMIFTERGFVFQKSGSESEWTKGRLQLDWGGFTDIAPPYNSLKNELPDSIYMSDKYYVKGLLPLENMNLWILWHLEDVRSILVTEKLNIARVEYNMQFAEEHVLSQYKFLADTLIVIKGNNNETNTEVHYFGFLK